MNSEHANFIRNSRKFLHCGECGRPFDSSSHKPRVLSCGHNVCEQCVNSQRLSTGAVKCCMVCDSVLNRADRNAPVSHDLLGIVHGKEQALKKVPLKYRCGECSSLFKENDMTVCRTCSGWSEGMQTEEATDFAKRPISSLLCWTCATSSKHATHDKMSIEIVNRIWDTPIATEYIETQLGTAEKLLDLLRGGAITQIKQLTDCFSEKLEVFKNKIGNGQFPLESTVHITKAVDVISTQIRNWNLGIQRASEDSHLLLEYFETLVKHVAETPHKKGNSKWEPPSVLSTDFVSQEQLRAIIKQNIREIRESLPIGEPKYSNSPEPDPFVIQERSSETTTATSTHIDYAVEPMAPPPPIQRRNHNAHLNAMIFSDDDFGDRPRRTTKKNYALEDDTDGEQPPKRRRGRRAADPVGEGSSNGIMHGDLSPYNLTGTHLANDPMLNQGVAASPPSRRGSRRGGRGRRRPFRGGRGSRGGYRHLAVNLAAPMSPDNLLASPVRREPSDNFDHDVEIHEDGDNSLDLSDTEERSVSREDSSGSGTPETERIFQELTGIGRDSSGVSSSSSTGGGKQPGDVGLGPSQALTLSPQNSSPQPPLVIPPPKIHTPLDFLGQTNAPRDMRPSSNWDGYMRKRPWEGVSQEERYGTAASAVAVADYRPAAPLVYPHKQGTSPSFIKNTPPY